MAVVSLHHILLLHHHFDLQQHHKRVFISTNVVVQKWDLGCNGNAEHYFFICCIIVHPACTDTFLKYSALSSTLRYSQCGDGSIKLSSMILWMGARVEADEAAWLEPNADLESSVGRLMKIVLDIFWLAFQWPGTLWRSCFNCSERNMIYWSFNESYCYQYNNFGVAVKSIRWLNASLMSLKCKCWCSILAMILINVSKHVIQV